MNDEPDTSTQALVKEIARHLEVSPSRVYEIAANAFAVSLLDLASELPEHRELRASDFLEILKQVPAPEDLDEDEDEDGGTIVVELPPASDGKPARNTLIEFPIYLNLTDKWLAAPDGHLN